MRRSSGEMGSAGLEFFFPFSQSVVRLPLSSVWVFAILAVTAPASPGGGGSGSASSGPFFSGGRKGAGEGTGGLGLTYRVLMPMFLKSAEGVC